MILRVIMYCTSRCDLVTIQVMIDFIKYLITTEIGSIWGNCAVVLDDLLWYVNIIAENKIIQENKQTSISRFVINILWLQQFTWHFRLMHLIQLLIFILQLF